MKICLDISVLGDYQKTGIGVYTYNLIKSLLNLNKTDNFILFGITTFKTYENLKNLEFNNCPNVKLKIVKLPLKVFRNTFWLWQKLNWPPIEYFVGNVDIFHSFNWYLPPVRMAKVIATVFDMTSLKFPKLHLKKTIQLDKIRVDRIKKYADLIITISENSKKDFLKFAPGKKVEVIYPGISKNFLRKASDEKINQVLKKYNLKRGYILSVGTLEPRKNLKFLIEAYLKSNLNKKLVLAGGFGWGNNELLDMIRKHDDKIIATGYVKEEDLPIFYKGADFFVYPSLYEGFGIPLLEAQASGCPVITSSVSSLPEAGGRAAIYVDPYSLEDLVRAIREIRGVREKLIKRGLKNISRFSWEASAKKLKSLYHKI